MTIHLIYHAIVQCYVATRHAAEYRTPFCPYIPRR